MILNRFFRAACGIFLFSICAAPMFAQATFGLASSTTTGADIGVTELTGQITLTVNSGITVAAPIAIIYSAPITTNYEVEIRVRGTGRLAAVAPYPHLIRTDNTITIDVPAGGVIGDTISIQGVRVSLAGGNLTSVAATASSPTGGGNSISAGQNTVTVINAVREPFSVDVGGVPPLSFTNGKIVQASSSFSISEAYVGAFSADVGFLGQTVPTTIRITPYPTELPPGVQVTFTAVASSGAKGWLTTTSGVDETIPRQDGSVDVVFQYTSEGGPKTLPQSFTISVTLKLQNTTDTGEINFQCALVPIGIAEPNTSFPSKDVPRYSERLVPDEFQLPGGVTKVVLNFPFRAKSEGIYTGMAMTNILNSYVNVILTPYDNTGTPLMEAVTVPIPPKNQIAKLPTDTDIFGPNFNVGKSGTIRAEAKSIVLPGFYLLGDFNGSRLDGATAELSTLQYWVWPIIFRQAPAPFTILEMYNPNISRANVTLRLFDGNGKSLGNASLSIPISGTVTQSIDKSFPGVDFSSFAGGFVRGESDIPLVVRETFGNSLDSNVLPGQAPNAYNTVYWPHFASGGGLTTEMTFVNTNATISAALKLTIFDSSGLALGEAQVSVPPTGQTTKTIAELFPGLPSSRSIVGYIQVENIPTYVGPFVFKPEIVAALRFSAANGSGSAALPLTTTTLSEFVYSHAVETAGYYTGIAILNKNAVPASITVEVFTNTGALVGTGPLTLQPGEKIAKLLHELVPAADGQLGGYVHIKSDQPVMSLSIFGSNNGLSLSAIPPQDIEK